MIYKQNILTIHLIASIYLFTNTLFSLDRTLNNDNCLSKIVSEQIYRITQRIEEITKEANSPYQDQQIKHLENQKQLVINTWRAQELTQILKHLPEDLKLRAETAKADFATPVLDTRDRSNK